MVSALPHPVRRDHLAAFSTAPLQLITFLGVLVFLCSLVLGCWSLWQKLSGQALEASPR